MPHAAPSSRARRWNAPGIGALVAALALAAYPDDGRAQRPTSSLGGVIVDAGTGRPLRGAGVRLLGTAGSETTDAEGRFLLFDVPSGRQRILIVYRGHETPERSIDLAPSRHTDVRIALALTADLGPEGEAIPLPPLAVRVERPPPAGKLRSFYQRLEGGRGAFITRDDILARDPTHMSDMLREIAGVRVSGYTSFDAAISTVRGCGLRVFIDGLPAPGFRIDDMPPGDVAGIEIYTGPSITPVQFRRPGGCGALVIWTRDPTQPG